MYLYETEKKLKQVVKKCNSPTSFLIECQFAPLDISIIRKALMSFIKVVILLKH